MYGDVPYPGRGVQLGRVLAERAAEHVELPRERVRAAAERRRVPRLQQAPLRHHDVQQRIEAVVEEDLGIVDHDQVDPDEHLEHALGEVEVDRAEGLRVGARPVEEGVLALTPDRQLHLVGAVAEPVVVDVVLERLRLLRDRDRDQELHRLVGAVEERLQRGQVRLLAEPLAELEHPPLAGPAPATIANRSARFISGSRTLFKISRRMSSCSTPRSTILTGGMMIAIRN